MVPGDIPDAALVAQARSMNIPLATTTAVPEGQAPEMPSAPIKIVQTMGGPTPPVPAPVPQPIRFAGNPAQRIKAQDDKKQEDYIKTLPADSPMRKALEYEQMTGKPAPAGMFQKPVHSAIYNEWQDAVNNGYKKDFVTYQNEDANRKDKATGAGTTAAAYKSAVTELEAAAKPVVAQMQSIDDLGTMINERTPQADALIAPMVLKATISGTGSGFRMTQAEINQVLGAGSKWQALERKLNEWQTDPSKALKVTDEQRDQLRSLAKAIRRKAHEKVIKLSKARHDLDDADGVDAIHRTMTSLKDDLYGSETADEPAKAKTAAELIAQYSKPPVKK
jgi:Spy/CpxP family protein refolding chaperone